MPESIAAVAEERMPGDDTPSTEIAERVAFTERSISVMPLMSDDEMHRLWRLALNLANSRMFKDAFQAEQAFAKILIGRDLGISPTQALMSIDLVRGAIQLRGVLLASFVRKSPQYHYKVLENTHEKARVLFLGYPQDVEEDGFVKSAGRWWEVLSEEEFTITDANRAKLIKTDSAWEHHPKNMCVWRCLSNGVKFHCPDLMGGLPVYVEGELDRDVAPTQAAIGAEVPALPQELMELVERAASVDATAWRVNEVVARLPLPDDASYAAAVSALTAEVEVWLAEHEPEDAEVVDAEPALDSAEDDRPAAAGAEGTPTAEEQTAANELGVAIVSDDFLGDGPPRRAEPQEDPDGVETVDVAAALQARWEQDADWRAQVEPLLHGQADLESSLDDAVASGDESTAEQLRDALAEAEGALDALGVPVGWVPTEATTDEA